MPGNLDVLNSALASTLRFWRGTNARAGKVQVPYLLDTYAR